MEKENLLRWSENGGLHLSSIMENENHLRWLENEGLHKMENMTANDIQHGT